MGLGDVFGSPRHSCSIPLKSRVRRRFFNSDTHPFIELIIPFVGFFEVFARVALSYGPKFEIRPAPFFLGELVLCLFEFSGGQSMVTLFLSADSGFATTSLIHFMLIRVTLEVTLFGKET